jgi:benzoylformate decarboxylase
VKQGQMAVQLCSPAHLRLASVVVIALLSCSPLPEDALFSSVAQEEVKVEVKYQLIEGDFSSASFYTSRRGSEALMVVNLGIPWAASGPFCEWADEARRRKRQREAFTRKEIHMPTVREATYELLRTLGLTTVFGNPGSTEQTFLQDFPSDFTYVLGLQEASVVAMADGYAQATGKPTLVNIHTSAGLGNAMGQIMEAWLAKAPLIITAGNQTRDWILPEPYLTNLAPQQMPQPFIKWSYEPTRSADIPAAIMRAYITAIQPPAGPVFLSFPFGDLNEQAGKPVYVRETVRRVEPDSDALRKFADILSQSRNPILFIGAGLDRTPGGWDAGIKLAEKLRIPVRATPFSERVSFPENHPQYQGMLPAALKPAGELLKGHDVALVVGAAAFRFYPYIPGEFPPPETRILVVSDDP